MLIFFLYHGSEESVLSLMSERVSNITPHVEEVVKIYCPPCCSPPVLIGCVFHLRKYGAIQ